MSGLYLLNPLNLPNLLTPTRVQLEPQFLIFSIIFISTLLYTLYVFVSFSDTILSFIGLGAFVALLFLFLALRERDAIDEAVVDSQFEKDAKQKLKSEADIKQYEAEKELLKAGGGRADDLTMGTRRKTGSIRDIRELDRKLEEARKKQYEADSNLKAYDITYKNDNFENIQGMSKFELDSIFNRDLKEVQGEMNEILEKRKKNTDYGKLRLKQLRQLQDKILKRQGEVAKLTGDDKLIKEYNLDRSNIELRRELVADLDQKGVKNPEELRRKNEKDRLEKVRVDRRLVDIAPVIVSLEDEIAAKVRVIKNREDVNAAIESRIKQFQAVVDDTSKSVADRNTALAEINTNRERFDTYDREIKERQKEKKDREERKDDLEKERGEKLKEQTDLAADIQKYNDLKREDKLLGKLLDPANEKVIKVKLGGKTRYYQAKDNNPRARDIMKNASENDERIAAVLT
jgi:hypothetical protein